jgi:hypothetical protein
LWTTVLAGTTPLDHRIIDLLSIKNQRKKMNLTFRFGLRFLEIHQDRKTGPPKLPTEENYLKK